MVIVSIDPRTGRLSLRDTGDLAASSRAPRFAITTEVLNRDPTKLADALFRWRLIVSADPALYVSQLPSGLTIFYLRQSPTLQSKKHSTLVCNVTVNETSLLKVIVTRTNLIWPANFAISMCIEIAKFGPTARAFVYIQLAMFPSHYLVLVITDQEFRFALIQVRLHEGKISSLGIDDLGWLDVDRIRGDKTRLEPAQPSFLGKRKADAVADADEDQGPGSPSRYVGLRCCPFDLIGD